MSLREKKMSLVAKTKIPQSRLNLTPIVTKKVIIKKTRELIFQSVQGPSKLGPPSSLRALWASMTRHFVLSLM